MLLQYELPKGVSNKLNWRMVGLEPFQQYHKSNCTVTADAKGRAKHFEFDLTHVRYPACEEWAFYPGDELPPFVKDVVPLEMATKVGQWVKDCEGTIVRVMEIWAYGQGFKVVTAMGHAQAVARQRLALNKIAHSSWGSKKTKSTDLYRQKPPLNLTDKKFLLNYVICNFNPLQAFILTYGSAPKREHGEMAKVKVILHKPEAMQYLMNSIQRSLELAGITEQEWVGKIIESTKNDISTSVRWSQWQLLGQFIPGVQKALREAKGELEPEGTKFGISDGAKEQQANFTDVCKICNGEKTYSATLGDGSVVTAQCPICSVSLPAVQTNGLRV